MKIFWKTMVTCDKDYCQSKKLLPKLKELYDQCRNMSLGFWKSLDRINSDMTKTCVNEPQEEK